MYTYVFSMNQLPLETRAQIINLLVEGNSLRGTSRILDISLNTVLKLLVDVGRACQDYQRDTFYNLPCKRIEVDEIWSFCYAKQKNVPKGFVGVTGFGDLWTWTAICPNTKLVPCWFVGQRDSLSAHFFLYDLARRFNHKVQLTSDGWNGYKDSVEEHFGSDVDYAMLVKLYGDQASEDPTIAYEKYVGSEVRVRMGSPDLKRISTSICERNNLTMRTQIKRFTRKTNAHSKKLENHNWAVALHFFHYNFVRIHSALRVTPAMAAGISDRVWSLEEILKI